jgi:hypothetical protein
LFVCAWFFHFFTYFAFQIQTKHFNSENWIFNWVFYIYIVWLIYNNLSMGIHMGIEEPTSRLWPKTIPALYQYQSGMGDLIMLGIYLTYYRPGYHHGYHKA